MNQVRYKSNTQQTVWDVALQFYGDAAGISEIFAENPSLINVDGTVKQGLVSHKINQNVVNQSIRDRMIVVVPSTGFDPVIEEYQILVDDDGNALVDDEGNVLVTIVYK